MPGRRQGATRRKDRISRRRAHAATRTADAHADVTRNRSSGIVVETLCISIAIRKAN
jgi:hypothetical protein